MTPLQEAALKYREMGLSVIPVRRDKKPVMTASWKTYQTTLATTEKILSWFAGYPTDGIAIITGKISGLMVLDIEAGADISTLKLPDTVTARTGGGGWHYYFNYPKDRAIKNSVELVGPKMDIRGEGGYVLAPPSLHLSGKTYTWVEGRALGEIGIADPPDWLLEGIEKPKVQQNSSLQKMIRGVDEGSRNNDGAILIGKLLHYLPEHVWEEFGWENLRAWNERNRPPLTDNELRRVYDSIATRERTQRLSTGDAMASEISKSTLWTIQQIAQQDFGPIEWTIERILPAQSIAALSGDPGNYKTWLTLEMAKAVAIGGLFLDRYTVIQGSVLVIDEENHLRHLKPRHRMLGIPIQAPIYYLSQTGFKTEDSKAVEHVLSVIKDKGIKLVIVDSLIRIHSQDENDAKGMARVLGKLQEFTKAGASVIFTHHHRKQTIGGSNSPSQSLRGSSDILAAVDAHMSVERREDKLTLRQGKMRHDEAMDPILITITQTKDEHNKTAAMAFRYEGAAKESDEKFRLTEEAVMQLMQNAAKPLHRREILEALSPQYGRNSVERALKSLEASKKIARVGKDELADKDRNAHVYRLAG